MSEPEHISIGKLEELLDRLLAAVASSREEGRKFDARLEKTGMLLVELEKRTTRIEELLTNIRTNKPRVN